MIADDVAVYFHFHLLLSFCFHNKQKNEEKKRNEVFFLYMLLFVVYSIFMIFSLFTVGFDES